MNMVARTKKLLAVDIFCGAGGASEALRQVCEALGYELDLTAINHDEDAIATHECNHSDVRHMCTGLESVIPSEVVPGRFLHFLLAGPSCTTHSRAKGGKPRDDQSRVLLLGLKPFVPAKDIIDWSIPAYSINMPRDEIKRRKLRIRRPLKPKTLARIEAGIRKYWGAGAEPFICVLHGNSTAVSINAPLPTQCCTEHFALVQPFLAPAHHGADDRRTRSIHNPLHTIAGKDAMGIVQPFLTKLYGTGTTCDLNDPLDTVTSGGNKFGLVQPMMVPQQSGGSVKPVSRPLPTVATSGAIGIVEPFLIHYYGNGGEFSSIHEPLPTVTTVDRSALIVPGIYQLDIGYRMLTPKELAAAHSFPKHYRFQGRRDAQVTQIGNSWPVKMGKAVIHQVLAGGVA